MKIIKLSYKDLSWELKELDFDKVNLIVGKNSTGKSRTLERIDFLVKIITQKQNLNWGGEWRITFLNDKKQRIDYSFATTLNKQGVSYEKMLVNDELVMSRNRNNPDNIKIKNYANSGKFENIYPPDNKLILHTNRDIKKYPFVEEISLWAENSFGFKFGNISPYSILNQQEYDFLTTVEEIPTLFKSLREENKKRILADFNSIGYKILDISVQEKADPIIFVKEEDIQKPIPHYRLSQGMFRSLAVIIYMEYLISRKKPATVIIDDLCEGLDYDRASKLGSLIFQKCIDSDIQLIATSNDNFLMETIDLKYWDILSRTGKVVTGFNSKSHPEIIKNFHFTGLSNFDFFSSDFLEKQDL